MMVGLEPLVNYPEPQFENIAAAAPDVIVNGLWAMRGGSDAAKLAATAPTFTYHGFDGDWRDDFTALAKAFGQEQVAEEFLQRVSARTAEVQRKVDALGEAVVAYGWTNADGSGGFNGSAPTTLGAQV
jgi:iron complex transport system substrate-binding protein